LAYLEIAVFIDDFACSSERGQRLRNSVNPNVVKVLANIFPLERSPGVEDRCASAVALEQRSEWLYSAILKKTG
jgi:hypothetical protein